MVLAYFWTILYSAIYGRNVEDPEATGQIILKTGIFMFILYQHNITKTQLEKMNSYTVINRLSRKLMKLMSPDVTC